MKDIAELYEFFLESTGISTDSRQISEDMLFFALRGENFNGNKYADKALEKGAVFAIIDDASYDKGDKYVLVNDALKTLQELATYHRDKLDLPVLAITGTNGKTTTKELIAAVLAQKYNIVATTGNLNNTIGVPLVLLSMKQDTEIGIVEMGANHPGEIDFLCKIAKPDYGLITNIGKAHLEGFGSFEGVKKTKAALYDYINEVNGTVFINGDNPILVTLLKDQEVIAYGSGEYTHYRGELLHASPYLTFRWTYSNPLGIIKENWDAPERKIETQITGKYNFENMMAAVSVGSDFGVTDDRIKQALESYVPQINRSQLIETEANTIILDAYNANPTSMELAINNLDEIEGTNKIAILGDMAELGESSEEEHRAIYQLLKKKNFLKVFLVGQEFARVRDDFDIPAFADVDELRLYLQLHPVRDATILIKASRSKGLENICKML